MVDLVSGGPPPAAPARTIRSLASESSAGASAVSPRRGEPGEIGRPRARSSSRTASPGGRTSPPRPAAPPASSASSARSQMIADDPLGAPEPRRASRSRRTSRPGRALRVPDPLHHELQVRRLDPPSPPLPFRPCPARRRGGRRSPRATWSSTVSTSSGSILHLAVRAHRVVRVDRPDDRRPRRLAVQMFEPQRVGEEVRDLWPEPIEGCQRFIPQREQEERLESGLRHGPTETRPRTCQARPPRRGRGSTPPPGRGSRKTRRRFFAVAASSVSARDPSGVTPRLPPTDRLAQLRARILTPSVEDHDAERPRRASRKRRYNASPERSRSCPLRSALQQGQTSAAVRLAVMISWSRSRPKKKCASPIGVVERGEPFPGFAPVTPTPLRPQALSQPGEELFDRDVEHVDAPLAPERPPPADGPARPPTSGSSPSRGPRAGAVRPGHARPGGDSRERGSGSGEASRRGRPGRRRPVPGTARKSM